MIVPFIEKDFLNELVENSTEQFKYKTIWNKYLQLEALNRSELQEVFKTLLQQRSIDEAVGEQLDVIGRIVGQPRTLISFDIYNFFAFKNYLNGDTYGDLTDPSKGGVFYSEGSPTGGNLTLDDASYRLFIKSKILKNKTASTPEELLLFLSYVFGNDTPIFIVEGGAHLKIFFGTELSTLEKNLLNYISYDLGYPSRLIPKTLAVSIEYGGFDSGNFFAFQGVPNAKGFASFLGWGENWGEDFGGTGILDGGMFASYY